MRYRKRDYQRKSFKNPFFPKKGTAKKKIKIFFFIVFFVFFAFSLYYLNITDFLKIKNIEISGNEKISSKQIRYAVENQMTQHRWLIFKQHNVLFFNKSRLKKELENNYALEKIRIEKSLFSGIKVEVKEKTFSAIMSCLNSYYYLDYSGIAVKKIDFSDVVIQQQENNTEVIRPQINLGEYPLIYNQNNEEIKIGEAATSNKIIELILNLNEEFENADFSISHYEIANSYAKDITLVTKEGFKVNFSTEKQASDQAELLSYILDQKVENRDKLQYIDLRFEEKIFYK